jgi:hypothetical protein
VARALQPPFGLAMGEVEAAHPRQRAVQLDGEARAVVLHDGELFFEVAARRIGPRTPVCGGVKVVDGG